jgi:hypothetical protein
LEVDAGVIFAVRPVSAVLLSVKTVSAVLVAFITCKTLPGEKLVAPVPPLAVGNVPVTLLAKFTD